MCHILFHLVAIQIGRPKKGTYFNIRFNITVRCCLRGTTIYLADRRCDMLPLVLSSDLCSLLSNVDRYIIYIIGHPLIFLNCYGNKQFPSKN